MHRESHSQVEMYGSLEQLGEVVFALRRGVRALVGLLDDGDSRSRALLVATTQSIDLAAEALQQASTLRGLAALVPGWTNAVAARLLTCCGEAATGGVQGYAALVRHVADRFACAEEADIQLRAYELALFARQLTELAPSRRW